MAASKQTNIKTSIHTYMHNAVMLVWGSRVRQEFMNHHGEKERWTSVPIMCRITLLNAPYMDYKLVVLMSFEVTTVTNMDSQESACCNDGHLLAS